jgi:arginyl-tRNA synthetase
MSALKYFILKVDPRKGMVFNPEESIDFNGNTGPFILFNYVRTQSILKKSTDKNINEFHYDNIELSGIEKELIAKNLEYFNALSLAAKEYSPAIIANYAYDLAKTYSQFYSSTYILNEVDVNLRKFRLYLNDVSGKTLQEIMLLLGIEMPNRM